MPHVDQRGYNHIKNRYAKKKLCKKGILSPRAFSYPVSTEPIMGTNSPFKSDHEKAGDDDTNTYDVDPD